MKNSILFAALAASSVLAQTPASPPKAAGTTPPVAGTGKCQKSADVKTAPDPLQMFDPKDAMFPCDMGSSVPLGPVPKGCAALEIIVARGTTEPGDLGVVVGDPLVARLKRDMPGVNVRGYPVQYPASMISGLTNAGPNDVKARLAAQSKECPDEKFALVGYSQGGMVVESSLAGIPAELQSKVVAVVTYGAGDGSGINASFKSKTLSNCAPGDFACPKSGSGPGHVSYNNQGTVWHDRSSQYIMKAYQGKPVGAKLMRSPTDSL